MYKLIILQAQVACITLQWSRATDANRPGHVERHQSRGLWSIAEGLGGLQAAPQLWVFCSRQVSHHCMSEQGLTHITDAQSCQPPLAQPKTYIPCTEACWIAPSGL